MKLLSIEESALETVYDITVDDRHHYILENGVITHNSGGGGLKYAASTIVFLTKSKRWEENAGVRTVSGAEITAFASKSRLTIENKKVETLLDYQHGLNRNYGLLDIAERGGVIKKISKKWLFPGMKAEGKKEPGEFEKEIWKNPDQYFTQDILDKIDEAVKKEFMYGSPMKDEPLEVVEEE